MFPLPGRSGFVDIVLTEFARTYCGQNKDLALPLDEDCRWSIYPHIQLWIAITSIVYALLMLNTDISSSLIKESSKLKPDQFIAGMTGINNGQDLPMDLLLEWYTEIKNHPITALTDKSLACDFSCDSNLFQGIPPPCYSAWIYTKHSIASHFKRQWCIISNGYLSIYPNHMVRSESLLVLSHS